MKMFLRLCVLHACLLIVPTFVFKPASAFANSIGKDKVNIRSAPGLESSIIFHAPLGYPIKIEKVMGKWVLFRDWENNTGWVHISLVSNVETAVILVESANVRSSATARSKVIAKARRGEIYRVLARNGRWLHLGYYFGGERMGWVRGDLVFGE